MAPSTHQPTVSLIVPTYNEERVIVQALEQVSGFRAICEVTGAGGCKVYPGRYGAGFGFNCCIPWVCRRSTSRTGADRYAARGCSGAQTAALR